MKSYVCGFMRDSYGFVALVRKNKPAWQAGRLNGVGGGVEAGETPHQAMCREWFEETGTVHNEWQEFATISFNDATIHFLKANVKLLPVFPDVNDIGEAIEVMRYGFAVRRDDMMQNLKWLLPLAFEDPDGLAVIANHPANDNGPERHGVVA